MESRTRFGHWQADGVIDAGCHLRTEVERRTKYPKAAVAPDKSAAGTEFAAHAVLLESRGTLTCFAEPYGSWQRGDRTA